MKIKKIINMWKERAIREDLYGTPEYWDGKAEKNLGNAISMWPNKNLDDLYHKEQSTLIEKYLPDVRGLKVLDLGCGTGRLSRYFAVRGASVLGIDFSPKTIEVAKKISPKNNPIYREMTIFDINEEKSFDLIISWGTIAVACKDREDLYEVMVKIRKSLRDQGKVFLLEPIHRGFLHRVLNMGLKEFCEVMVKAGFEIQEIINIHFWPMRLVLAFISWPKLLTAIGYYTGQLFLKLSRNGILGDYTAIYASSH
jgi:2-polyprenyl-3-methyl-5-hydroxy-6-metoxy-1,4-benzoquinol methylase